MWKIVQHIIQKQPPCKQTTSPPLGNQIGIQTNSRDCTYRVRAAPVCPEFISCHDWMWALMASDDLGPSANRPDLAKLGIAELRAHLCQGRSCQLLPHAGRTAAGLSPPCSCGHCRAQRGALPLHLFSQTSHGHPGNRDRRFNSKRTVQLVTAGHNPELCHIPHSADRLQAGTR